MLLLSSAPAIAGVTRLPVEATLCHDHSGVQSWGYEATDDVRRGRRDRTGLLVMSFAGPGRGSELLRVPVPSLRWERAFHELVARNGDGEPIGACAVRTWHGVVKEERCRLEGRVEPSTVASDECGEGAPTYTFTGAIVVTVD